MPAWNFATLVDAIARATPGREVIVDGTRRITWQQLAFRARSLAWYLHAECGLGPADKVAIVLPNCLEYVETFLATRKLQGVPLGLDPGSGADVIGTAIDGSDARVVVSSHALGTDPAPGHPPDPETMAAHGRRGRPTVRGGDCRRDPSSRMGHRDPDRGRPHRHRHPRRVGGDGRTRDDPVARGPTRSGGWLRRVARRAEQKGKGRLRRPARLRPPSRVADRRAGGGRRPDDQRRRRRPAVARGAPGLAQRLLADESENDQVVGRAVESRRRHRPRDRASGRDDRRPGSRTPEPHAGDAAHLVDPSDVEARLRKHASVADCVVLGISDPRVGKVVVAIVQVTENHHLDAAELAAWCRAHVPADDDPRAVRLRRPDRAITLGLRR